ncbi:hypothetical protein DIS24_g3815 [Lasiodiplodia hormozganensis]|uniref:Thioredoxin-like protein AAED1 n=1 Tax=Lasiodiplodia hormozganensis TaxID=869390 RepID=A0AA40D1R0_9PEZI|nr:hypothetical protein DIS24_g3815 [Lasiodiplodia hormozganensis]
MAATTEPHQPPASTDTKPDTQAQASAAAPAPETIDEKDASLAKETGATAAACDYDPSADFKGDVQVSQELPTEADIRRCEDMLVLGADGESRPFKSLYSGEGVATRQLIIFVRHFFCGNCQEYLRTLSASITPDALLALDTPTFITVVGCGRPELIPMYAQTTNCPFPIFADPTTKLYDHLGMMRTLSLGPKRPDYMKASMVSTTMQSMYQCIKSGKGIVQGGDLRQVGGEMLFEDGRVTWVHRMKNTRDHAEVEDLRSILGLTGKDEGRRERRDGFKAIARSMSWSRRQERSKERGKERSRSREPKVVEMDEGASEVKEKEQRKSKRRSFFQRADTNSHLKAEVEKI